MIEAERGTGAGSSRGSGSSGEPEPAWILLRSGLVPASAAGALVTLFAVTDGARAVIGALVGAALTVVAFCAGPLLMRAVRKVDPVMTFALALTSYLVVVIVLAMAYGLLSDASWLSADFVGGAILACAAGWLVGQIRATAKLRVLTFGHDGESDSGGGARLPNTR